MARNVNVDDDSLIAEVCFGVSIPGQLVAVCLYLKSEMMLV